MSEMSLKFSLLMSRVCSFFVVEVVNAKPGPGLEKEVKQTITNKSLPYEGIQSQKPPSPSFYVSATCTSLGRSVHLTRTGKFCVLITIMIGLDKE